MDRSADNIGQIINQIQRDLEELKTTQLRNEDIPSGAITTPKLADGAVTADKLASGAATTVKIADNAVTLDKLSTDLTTYSTTKKQIGVWTDGRPVYRLVYIATTATAVNEDVTVPGLEVDILISAQGSLTASNGLIEPIQRICADGNMTTYSLGIGDLQPGTGGYKFLFQHSSNLYQNVDYCIIFEYVEPAA